MLILKLLLVKRLFKSELVNQGYSEEQAEDIIVNEIGDGKILAWLKKYGPKILEIILMILPLVMSKSKHIPLGRRLTTVPQFNDLSLPTAQEIWDTNE